MKHLLCTLALLIVGTLILSAQKKYTAVVKTEITYEKILPADMLYEYNEFKKGKLYYKDGGAVLGEYNFNLLSGSCLFKTNSGAIMEMTYPEQILFVTIDSSRWYQIDNGFGQVIYSTEHIDLIKRRTTKCIDIRKEGAFGGVSSTSSVTSITSFKGNGSAIQSLSVPGEYDFEVKEEYFLKIGDKIEFADAKGFKNLLPDQKSKIGSTIKSKKLKLDKIADIIELIKALTFN